jgi:AAHS family benzoate transporter-like MFS transporter
MTATLTGSPEQEARRRSTVKWVVGLATLGLIFDGYDLVIYGAVVSTFLRDPSQIGEVSPQLAGALGSYALIGVLVGALLAGTIADIVGRRTVMLIAYAWFSIAMGITAMMSSATTFGLMRFITGLGVGALVATTGAIVSEYAPPGKKNLCNAITYSGVPTGSLLAALLAIILLASIGWRGMFWIGALPLVTLLPLAFFKMPESPAWLLSRGRVEEARAVAERTGMPLPDASAAPAAQSAPSRDARPAATTGPGRAGFAGLFGPGNAFPAILLGFMSVTGLLLVYALNTWLPELMRRVGYDTKGSLSFLLVLNGGAIIGALILSRVADRFGPKPVVASCFLCGAISIGLLTFSLPLGLLLLFVAFVGLGTSGTQTLLFGFVANYFRTNVRGAAVAWCAGFGRLGGVGGPLLGGFLIGAGFALNSIFYILAGLAFLGMLLTLLVPVRHTHELHRTPIEPSGSVAAQGVAPAGRPTP